MRVLKMQAGCDASTVTSSHGAGAEPLSSRTKSRCRELYQNRCAFCGRDDVQLSVAHLAVRDGSFNESPTGHPYTSRKFKFDDVRNTILLCKDYAGSCHDMLDAFSITLVPSLFGDEWAIHRRQNSAWHLARRAVPSGKYGKLPPYLDFRCLGPDDMPHRRVLTVRYRTFLQQAGETRERFLEVADTMAELSARCSVDEDSDSPRPTKRHRKH